MADSESIKSLLPPITNQLLNKIIQIIPGNIYWKDRQGRYLGCNDNQLKVANLKSVDEIIGKTDFDLYEYDIAKKVQQIDEYVMNSNAPMKFEESGVNEKGADAIYMTDKQPLYDDNQNVCGIVGISLDITEKKMSDQLQAMKMAFIQNMEHDIRTPCGGILGITDYLWKLETDPVKKESLGFVTDAAKELLEYNNKIIEFAQMHTEKWPIVQREFEIKQLLERAVALEKPAALYKHLDLKLKIATDVPLYIASDDYRWFCIIVNLLSNAIKFTEFGRVTITLITLDQTNQGNFLLQLKVIDTGIGVSPEKKDTLYLPFNRLSPSNQNKYKGVGLGLTIVKRFIRDLNGSIEINSVVNEGTIINCIIPVSVSLNKAAT